MTEFFVKVSVLQEPTLVCYLEDNHIEYELLSRLLYCVKVDSETMLTIKLTIPTLTVLERQNS